MDARQGATAATRCANLRDVAYRVGADLVALIHLAFVAFVVGGAFAVARWPRVAWAHLPAATWAALVELAGWPCPLTPLENALRRAAGLAGYPGGFVEHYLVPVIYPAGLTRTVQIALGVGVVVLVAAAYAIAWQRARDAGAPSAGGGL